MQIKDYISVVQRRVISLDESVAEAIGRIKPLFMIDTHMTFEERMQLFSIAVALPQGFVACEVGSYLGASTAFLAAGASYREGHVHAVDTWQNDAMEDELPEDTFARFEANTLPYRAFITAHRGTAVAMQDQIPPLDLLFLDGDHSYQGVCDDLRLYAGKIKPGGTLLLHDFNLDPVSQAVRDTLPAERLEDIGRVASLQSFRIR